MKSIDTYVSTFEDSFNIQEVTLSKRVKGYEVNLVAVLLPDVPVNPGERVIIDTDKGKLIKDGRGYEILRTR